MFRKVPRPACRKNLFSLVTAFLVAISPAGFSQAPAQQVQTSAPTPWQPAIHFNAAPNWVNDPNGPILLDGQYHLFFQLNPFGDQAGHISWGHAVSSDLAHWKQLPVALAEENGVMILGGSTVEEMCIRDSSY